MARLFLLLGCILAVIACIVSVIGFLLSVSALISDWGTVTGELLGRSLFWAYAFVMNGALCVVFSQAIERGPPQARPSGVNGFPANDGRSPGA